MNKMVAKPNLKQEEQLNAKIEKIFNVEAFQRMVDNAEVFQDLSTSSIFNNSELLQRSANANLSFKKLLPTHTQLQEEDDEEEDLPKFGTFDQQQQEQDDSIN